MCPRCVIKKKCVTDSPRKTVSARNVTFTQNSASGSDAMFKATSEEFHKSENVQQKRKDKICYLTLLINGQIIKSLDRWNE